MSHQSKCSGAVLNVIRVMCWHPCQRDRLRWLKDFWNQVGKLLIIVCCWPTILQPNHLLAQRSPLWNQANTTVQYATIQP